MNQIIKQIAFSTSHGLYIALTYLVDGKKVYNIIPDTKESKEVNINYTGYYNKKYIATVYHV